MTAAAEQLLGLQGQVALVTGGAGALGIAICDMLSRLGAVTYVSDLDLDACEKVAGALREDGRAAHAIELDVTDAARSDGVVDAIAGEQGRLDILVTVAGWSEFDPRRGVMGEDVDYWTKVTNINYLGTVYPSVAAMRVMRASGRGGRIITIGSEAGRIGNAGQALYCGAKAGVAGFTRAIAREGARFGILANVVSPGIVDTPLARRASDEDRAKMVKASVLRRFAEPEEIAAPVAFLASPAASYITGTVVSVSGGMTMIG